MATTDERAVEAAMAAGDTALTHIISAMHRLPDRFAAGRAAVELLLASTNRVIVTGIGKSGLVGAKLAATLTSTGTSAYFVHAADALHGDAGVVCEGDVLLAISNSGETDEVVAFAQLVKDRGVRVVALTGCDGSSSLSKLADVRLDVGVDCEADPYDLVPTASTVATAVMGDAIAVALMVARGFGPEDFHRHHPGGALGRRLVEPGGFGGD